MGTTRGKRRPQDKKDKILQTTMQLLLKKGGYSTTSTTDICNACKLTRPTLYHYFGSKRNLMFSLHMYSIEKVLKPYLTEAASIADPFERLKYMIRAFARVIYEHPELRVLIHDTLAMNDKYFREVREEWKKHYLLLRSTIAQLQSDGRLKPATKPSLGSLFLLGMTTWMTYWLDNNKESSVDDLADAVLEFALHGLGATTD